MSGGNASSLVCVRCEDGEPGQPLSDYLRERGRPGVADMIEDAERTAIAAQEPHAAPEVARVRAELTELTENHEQLLEEILKNADEDVNGGDEAAESLAEQYVRWLEAEREQLLSDARERELAKPAPELAAAMAETRLLRELVREICDQLVSQKYPAARVAPWLKAAGLTP